MPFVTARPTDLGLQVELSASTLIYTSGDETWQDTRTTDGQNNYLYLNYDEYDPTPHAKPTLFNVGSENAYLGGVVGGFDGLFTVGAYTPLTAVNDMRVAVTVNMTSAINNVGYIRLCMVEFDNGDTLESRVRTQSGGVLQLFAVYIRASLPGTPLITPYRTIPQGVSTTLGFRTELNPSSFDVLTEINGADIDVLNVPIAMRKITSVTPFVGFAESNTHNVNLKLYKFEFTSPW
jgi:hypothetical protein